MNFSFKEIKKNKACEGAPKETSEGALTLAGVAFGQRWCRQIRFYDHHQQQQKLSLVPFILNP